MKIQMVDVWRNNKPTKTITTYPCPKCAKEVGIVHASGNEYVRGRFRCSKHGTFERGFYPAKVV